MAGANQGFLDLLLREIHDFLAVQVTFDFQEIVGWDRALKYFYIVAIIGLEMECAGGLQERAGVVFEGGMLEAEEIGG